MTDDNYEVLAEGGSHLVARTTDEDGDTLYILELFARGTTLLFHDPTELFDLVNVMKAIEADIADDVKEYALRVCPECGVVHEAVKGGEEEVGH